MQGRLLIFFLALLLPGVLKADLVSSSLLWRTAVVSTIGLAYIANPLGADVSGIELGTGEGVDSGRLYLRWHWSERELTDNLQLGLYGQVAYERWLSQKDNTADGINNLLILTPVFRLTIGYPWTPDYLETSIGAALLSKSKMEATDHSLGQNFQFEDTLALGWLFGSEQRWDLSWRFRHYSNNGLSEKNSGINFNLISLQYRY